MGQSSFGCCALSTILKTRRVVLFRDQKPLQPTWLPRKPNQRSGGLSWRAFVVRQNFSNCRRKVIDAGTRHDDAVAAAMSFFGDAQESSALVFPELHVEMLALNLQFSRLDNVIHFFLRPPTLPHPFWGMEEKSAESVQILCARIRLATVWLPIARWGFRSQADRYHSAIRLRCWLVDLQSRAPSDLNPTGIEEYGVVFSK
jgi:hypothetical protein